jgi:hypothetical protein
MKNLLRWIAVLPGAVAAMILVNALNGLTVAMIFPVLIDECCKAWFGSLAFVLAAYYIAPKGKFLTAVVVASSYCAIGLFAVLVNIRSGHSDHPIWLQILTAILTVLASVLACTIAWSLDHEKQPVTQDEGL